MKELVEIQHSLKAPKNQYNSFGKYKYRNAEDILESVKPLLHEHGCSLTISDDIILVGDRIYVKATATITNKDGVNHVVAAFAREEENKKGLDAAQLTGATSSYARKYALNGLFCIDDTKDADSDEATALSKQTTKTTATPAPQARATTQSSATTRDKATLKMEQVSDALLSWIDKQNVKYTAQGKTMSASEIARTGYDVSDAVAEHIDTEYRYYVRKKLGGISSAPRQSAIESMALEFENGGQLV